MKILSFQCFQEILEQCIILTLFLRFQKRSQIALKIDYVSILLVWEVDLSALSGVIYLHSIARFLFYHMVIFIWHSRKRHRNFQGIPNFGSSRKTRISKTFAQHRSVLSKCVLWRPPREYKCRTHKPVVGSIAHIFLYRLKRF